MDMEQLLSHLDAVKQTAPNRWIARCPAHADSSPSLTLRATEDGRLLIHDFGGCEPIKILDAIGLKFSDLFATALSKTFLGSLRVPLTDREALRLLEHEMWVIALLTEQSQAGDVFSHEAIHRMRLAGHRIHDIIAAIPR